MLISQRLDRDYPSLFFCEFCEAFHRYNGSEAFSLSGLYDEVTGKLPNCIENWWFTAPFLLPAAPDISSLHLKLAMKRLIHGPGSGINLESLGFEYVRHFSLEPDVSDALSLQSREFRAWSDRPGLYARLQTILLVSSWREFTESAFKHGFKNCYTHPIFKEIKVCGKKCLFDPETLQQFTGKPRDLLIPHYLDIPPGEQEVRKSLFCTACNCECQVRLYSFDSKTAVVITRWIDLGCGFLKKNDVYHIHGVCTFTRGPGQPCTILSNPDQNDPYAIAERAIEIDKVSVAVEGGPWGCFETVASQASNTHDDLTLRNLIHLIDGDYKRDMSFLEVPGAKLWYKTYQEPSKVSRFWSKIFGA